MAVVAVLLIHIERNKVVNPVARRIRVFLWPMDFRERIEKASFWSREWTLIALARMKLPKKSMIMGLANGANAFFTGAI